MSCFLSLALEFIRVTTEIEVSLFMLIEEDLIDSGKSWVRDDDLITND